MKTNILAIAQFIVAITPRRLAGSIAGLALAAGMAPILTAAENPAGELRGWSVVSVSIPKNGELKDAYVELKSPAGRVVTLTSGVTAQEGVTLDKLEWSGSPIRAVVSMRKGEERAERSVEASSISQRNDLSKKLTRVEIESKFIEIPAPSRRNSHFRAQLHSWTSFPAPRCATRPRAH